MGDPFENRSEKHINEIREHAWTMWWAALPPAVLRLVVHRIGKRDSLCYIAQYLHSIEPELSEGDFLEGLGILAKKINTQPAQQRPVNLTPPGLDDLNNAEVHGTSPEAQSELAGKASAKPGAAVKGIKATANRTIDNTERDLLHAWVEAQTRADGLVDLERKTNMVFPRGYKIVEELRVIANKIAQHRQGLYETRRKGSRISHLRRTKDAAGHSKNKVPKLSEEERMRLAKDFFDSIRGESGE